MDRAGKIILLNGASSSGKSTISHTLQEMLDEPFWHISIDHLRDSGVLPLERIRQGEFVWRDMREAFFIGFERSLLAFASVGNNLIVEYIVESKEWGQRLFETLTGTDLFVIGVHCPLDVLHQRERERGDRPLGDAKRDFYNCHCHCRYDLEVDGTLPAEDNAAAIIAAWRDRLK